MPVKERMAGRVSFRLLSCQDIVEMLRHKLPSKIQSDEYLVMTIANRHTGKGKSPPPLNIKNRALPCQHHSAGESVKVELGDQSEK